MNLKIFTPTEVVLDTSIQKIDFEAIDGYFTLLPKHIDFINALKSTIIVYTTKNQTNYVACNKGVIVKKGDIVSISTPLAILSDNLEKLKRTIEIDFKKMEEAHKEVLLSMARLELGLTKGLMTLNQNGGAHVGL